MNDSPSSSCPRCDYDLSGVVASWRDACPLAGTCSECGLEIDWRRILDPRYHFVPGFYEHARGLALKSAWRTWLSCVLPWRFAARVRWAPFVRLRRATAWIFVIWLSLSLTRSLIGVTGGIINSIKTPASPYSDPSWMWVVNSFLWPFATFYRDWAAPNRTPPRGPVNWYSSVSVSQIVVALAITLTPAVVLFALGRRADGQRPPWRSVARLAPYGFAWIAAPYLGYIALISHWTATAVLAATVGGFTWYGSPIQLLTSPPFLAGVIVPWLVLWWWFMAKRVLMLRQPTMLCGIATVISWLLTAVLFLLLDRSHAFLTWLAY